MPNTARNALPYPGLTDAPNVPSQMQALAAALDNLKSHGHVALGADYAFPSDGFNYLTPFAAVISNGPTLSTSYRYAVPKAGTWWLTAQARITRGAASASAYTMLVRKNSADAVGSGSTVAAAWAPGAVDQTLVTHIPLVLAAGDYLQMFVAGLSGSTLKGSGNFATYMALRFEHF